ncbi:beta-glucosidase [Sphingorhabdus contaminans]|uniref:beta-glucosidase family protein n=1 Tax=Sphingorhabdus contaminans TaxID=1343899 RepID=UPI003D2E1ECC
MTTKPGTCFAALAFCSLSAGVAVAGPPSADEAWDRADATVKALRADEKVILTHGIMPLPVIPNAPPPPAEAIPGAGYIAGIPRLGIPPLTETDASLGVSYVFGLRGDGATALPSGLAQAASWNPELIRHAGATIGAEARAKGFNVLLAGGANLMRDPRNGRTFEYFSEDPLLTGVLAGNAIAGVQSNRIISTTKHFALNGQETGRKFVDVKIGDAAARESDLLAFQMAIEIGNPGSVMCAYNRVNGEQGCASDYLLNRVLKRDWGYKGFVMSDWGAVPGLDAALKGLDQQSGQELDPAVFFADKLGAATQTDPRYRARVDDMNRRILWAIYANGLDKNPVKRGGDIDLAKNSEVALEVAKQGIVLLKNEGNLLPAARQAKRIVVIGGYADSGVMSGAGSSQVHGKGGPAVAVPTVGSGPWAALLAQQYHRSSPLSAIKAMAPQASVTFRDGRFTYDAVSQARDADLVLVFANKWSSEGFDQPDLSMPSGQDDLIDAVARANPRTVVVLQTGNPVAMPWLDKVPAVIQAWYPGARGGDAIASVLFGETNPSGRLPITFPASLNQLPRPKLDGYDELEPNFSGTPPTPDAKLVADYDIEGSDLGYRWNARKGYKALFPFGFGLSYTTFSTSNLRTDGKRAQALVRNTGNRPGATVVQLYMVEQAGTPKQRLVGFQRVELAAGEIRPVEMTIDPRLLADWNDGWHLRAGNYSFALGENAEALGPSIGIRISSRHWKD